MLRSLSIQNICQNDEQWIAWIKNPGLQEHFVNLMANCTIYCTVEEGRPIHHWVYQLCMEQPAKTKRLGFFAWFFVSLVTEHDILPKFSQEPVLMFSGCIGINWHWKLAIINPTTTFTVMKNPKSVPSAFKFTYSHKWLKSFATQREGGEKKNHTYPCVNNKPSIMH